MAARLVSMADLQKRLTAADRSGKLSRNDCVDVFVNAFQSLLRLLTHVKEARLDACALHNMHIFHSAIFCALVNLDITEYHVLVDGSRLRKMSSSQEATKLIEWGVRRLDGSPHELTPFAMMMVSLSNTQEFVKLMEAKVATGFHNTTEELCEAIANWILYPNDVCDEDGKFLFNRSGKDTANTMTTSLLPFVDSVLFNTLRDIGIKNNVRCFSDNVNLDVNVILAKIPKRFGIAPKAKVPRRATAKKTRVAARTKTARAKAKGTKSRTGTTPGGAGGAGAACAAGDASSADTASTLSSSSSSENEAGTSSDDDGASSCSDENIVDDELAEAAAGTKRRRKTTTPTKSTRETPLRPTVRTAGSIVSPGDDNAEALLHKHPGTLIPIALARALRAYERLLVIKASEDEWHSVMVSDVIMMETNGEKEGCASYVLHVVVDSEHTYQLNLRGPASEVNSTDVGLIKRLSDDLAGALSGLVDGARNRKLRSKDLEFELDTWESMSSWECMIHDIDDDDVRGDRAHEVRARVAEHHGKGSPSMLERIGNMLPKDAGLSEAAVTAICDRLNHSPGTAVPPAAPAAPAAPATPAAEVSAAAAAAAAMADVVAGFDHDTFAPPVNGRME